MGNTALLVIDAQVGIIEGPKFGPVFEKEMLLGTMKKVVDKARSEAIPIIFMMDTEIASPISIESQVHPHISPTRDDITITKKATDAFQFTTLHDYLQTLAIKHLVVMGCKTEYGVDTTCRRATTLGYDVTLVADGHSTTANKVLGARRLSRTITTPFKVWTISKTSSSSAIPMKIFLHTATQSLKNKRVPTA